MRVFFRALLAVAASVTLCATPAMAKTQVNQLNQARVSHAPFASNSTFVTRDTHVLGFDRDPTVRYGTPLIDQAGTAN